MSPQSSFNVDAFRQTFDKRLGEIITDVLGDDRIQKLFEESGGHPSEYEGVPTGDIAFKLLDKGVLTQETKTALLVAQAAERTARLADKALDASNNREAAIQSKTLIDAGDILQHNDPVFKFVGSERDPVELQKAQGSWQIAQLAYNNEVGCTNGYINSPEFMGNPLGLSGRELLSLKQAAADNYEVAARMMQKEGHHDAAHRMQAVAAHLQSEIPANHNNVSPAAVAGSLVWNEHKAIQDLDIVLGAGQTYYRADEAYVGTLKKLERITDSDDGGDSPAAEPSDDPTVEV